MPECVRCDGAGYVPVPGGMTRCPACAVEPLTCRGDGCMDPFRCNVAGACSLPEPQPWDWEGMAPGAFVQIPISHANRARMSLNRHKGRTGQSFLTRTGPAHLLVWRIT